MPVGDATNENAQCIIVQSPEFFVTAHPLVLPKQFIIRLGTIVLQVTA
jgi:hypothetical protein